MLKFTLFATHTQSDKLMEKRPQNAGFGVQPSTKAILSNLRTCSSEKIYIKMYLKVC